MLSKFDGGKRGGEDLHSEKLLRDIDAINKAIYPDRSRPRSSVSTLSSRSKSTGKTSLPEPKSKSRNATEEPLNKDKRSFWNWKPLKAFSHVRNRRFNCCFSLQVHSIEGLPVAFNDANLCVHWKRRDGELISRPVRVSRGIAEFEEQLTHVCSVYGSRSGPHQSAKYEAKHFLLYASVVGTPEFDLGKHRVELTRLLPLTLEELEGDKSSAKWTTSYKLSGKAKGAVMNVSFGYSVVGDNSVALSAGTKPPELQKSKQNTTSMSKSVTKLNQAGGRSVIRRTESVPTPNSPGVSQSVEDVKVLHEVFPISKSELSSSVNMLYQKLDEEKLGTSVDYKPELGVSTECIEPFKPTSDLLPNSSKETDENDFEGNEFSVVEHGIELSSKEQVKSDERTQDVIVQPGIELPSQDQVKSDEGITLKAADGSSTESPDLVENDGNFVARLEEETALPPHDEEGSSYGDNLVAPECSSKDGICTKESLMKELESALNIVSNLEVEDLDSPEERENCLETPSNFKVNRMRKSHSLDDVTESVASEFLNMMGIEHSPFGMSSESDPESPREALLRQFEKDSLASGCALFDFGFSNGNQVELDKDSSEDFLPPLLVEGAAEDVPVVVNETKAKMLENLETEALMREWGFNEKAFQGSPPNNSGGFGSPIHDLHSEDPIHLPPLGDGLGPFAQTSDGGILRSMNPALFRSAKSGGSLIMQASRPVVVPAEMGSDVMEILQHLASVGIEKLSMQANKLMPLEDITGSTVQQMAWEAAPTLEAPETQALLQNESVLGQDCSDGENRVKEKPSSHGFNHFNSIPGRKEMDSEYVSLEELAPLAMDKIEALSIEGLRIQSGMSNEEAPLNTSSQSIGDISAQKGKRANLGTSLGLEGAAGLQLLDMKGNDESGDELMGLSLTLDEWMRLDSGEIDDEDEIDERTSKILTAHHAVHRDLFRRGLKGEKRRGKGCKRKCGLLGNNFTVALMVQLRDPLRNYEPVGAPMLALIQVERVFVPPKPIIYSTVSEVRSGDKEDEKEEKKEEMNEEKSAEGGGIPQFKVTEVLVAGLKTEPDKKKVWGNTNQQQSGSRWLLANGMGKNNKLPNIKSKSVAKSTPAVSAVATSAKAQLGDALWSISARVRGAAAKWKESAPPNPHTRNPNVRLW